MKPLIAGTVLFLLFCVAVAGAAPAGTGPAGFPAGGNFISSGALADSQGIVATHETIREQRQDIREDVRDTHQDIHENLSAGHADITGQRQAMRQDIQENREAVQNNDTTMQQARQDLRENLSAGHEAIREERQNMTAFVHGSGVALVQNVSELRAQIAAERKTEQDRIANLSDAQKARLTHWADATIAAQSLMAMQNLTGDIGPQVAAIADGINSSESSIAPLEQRIDNRNAILRFMFGGDRTAAGQIANLTAANQQRIQALQALMQNSTLQPDVQQAMQDQIDVLQQEQARLANLTATEQKSTGLFWWI